MKVTNKIVLLTGSGSGIGRCLAGELASRGAKLILTDISQESIDETINIYSIQDKVITSFTSNLLDNNAPDDIFTKATETANIDILINNAGMMAMGQVKNMQWRDFERMQTVNQNAAIKLSWLFLKPMIERKNGAIAFTCSASAICSPPGAAFYSMTKAAVNAYSESLRAEVSQHNISVTSVCPGFVHTPLAKNIDYRDSKSKETTQSVPKIVGSSPERIARLFVNAIEQKKGTVLIGWDEKVKYFIKCLMRPAFELLNRLMGKLLLDKE